jgi:hypothetical protein
MSVYLVDLTAWSSPRHVHRAIDPGEHEVRFAVRAHSPADARSKVLRHSVGWLPLATHEAGGIYSLTGGLGPGAVVLDEFHIDRVVLSRARVRPHTWCKLSVCADCMCVIANGECGDRPADLPEPCCKVRGEDVVLGVDEHADGCAEDVRAENGCDCADLGFRTSWCDACGDTHHGDRFAAVILREKVGKLWVERL